MMRTLFLLLALSLPLFAFAGDEGGVHVVPFGPTSDTPVDVHIPMICGFDGQTMTRAGDVFRITLLKPACVITIPIPYITTVRLPGLLPVGEYRVEVFLEGTAVAQGSTDFVVRNAAPKPFEVHPFAVPAFGGDLRIHIEGGVVCCEGVQIDVGGVRATNLTLDPNGGAWFDAPPHAEGLADVRVSYGNTVVVSPGALYYFDEPKRSVFERILFPVLFSTGGANASSWVTEATLSNPRPWFVENANTLSPIRPCLVYPCGERIAPFEVARYADGFPHGVTLLAPRPEAPDLAFALRIRDVSRQAEGLGTRVPVVRERDFTHGGGIALLDVPLDPGYRVKLRVYMIEPLVGGRIAQMVLRNPATNAAKLHTSVELQSAGPNEPYYAEVDLTPGAANERVNVYLSFPLDSTAWAFATVTNNATQQVTIVTPNGSGEQPCTGCTF
jgi:hypothetical protein